MFPVWPLLVYFFTTGLGDDFQALISPSGVAGIDQAGKCTQMMRLKIIPALWTFASYGNHIKQVITLTADRLYFTDHSLCPFVFLL